jgi:hypothetical protein
MKVNTRRLPVGGNDVTGFPEPIIAPELKSIPDATDTTTPADYEFMQY